MTDAGRGEEMVPAPPETILRVAEDGGVNGEVCITEGASQHIRAEIERLRKVEEAAGQVLAFHGMWMAPASGEPGVYKRLREALEPSDD